MRVPSPGGTSTACTRPSTATASVTGGPSCGSQVAVQPGIAATERTTRAPCGVNTVAAAGSAGAPDTSLTHDPRTDWPCSAWMVSGARASRSVKTANEPSRPAYVQRGGTRAFCSWPSAVSALPPPVTTTGAPSELGARPAWTVTATLAAGPGTVIASSVADTARAVNQRVWPTGAVSPILVPAAASCLAPWSGTVTLATCTGEPRYQVVRCPAATRLLPVPAGPAAGWPAA